MSHDMKMIAAQLRSGGYRVTPQRQLILEAVCELGGHVTADAIYGSVRQVAPTLNQGTVYRTLNFFCEQGIVTATQRADGLTVYELAGKKRHHHFVCRNCGANYEVAQETLQPLFDLALKECGFAVEMDHISFFGRCRDCQ